MNDERALDNAIEKTISELEAKGVTREQIHAMIEDVRAEQDREAMEPVVTDPMDEISDKIDKLQESVDALAAKLDRE